MRLADAPELHIKVGESVVKIWLPIFITAMLAGCGGPASTSPMASTSTSTSTSTNTSTAAAKGNTIRDLQAGKGWNGYALLPPGYGICESCAPSGPQTTWSTTQSVSSPSLSGKSMQFTIGGKTTYSDVLWNNHLIGQFSSQGMPDTDNSINSSLHNFVYDVYFFGNNIGAAQAIEFDINQFVGGQSYIWGHQCRIAGGNEWDVWDNPGQKWRPTGVPCNPLNNRWNHLTIQVQRTSDSHLLFQSITLNGNTTTVNHYDKPTSSSWSGVTVNYQQDGNYKEQSYSIWLDKLNFRYW